MKNFQSMGSRPKSAKAIDKKIIAKKKNGRPISAKKNLVNIASKLSLKPPQDAYLLNRLKPTYIAIDKERLYEDNMALKLAVNNLQAENIKIKTRVTHLEKENSKKDDIIEELSANEKSPGHKYIHLVSNLKQTIKETKYELKSRDDEIQKLKRNIKSSKIMELEIQIQSYEEECRRLSQNLLEALNKQPAFLPVNDYDKKLNNDLVSSLKKENSELKSTLSRVQDDLKKYQQEKVNENEKKKKGAAGQQVVNLKLEIQKLRTQMETLTKETREKEASFNSELAGERRKNDEFRNKLESEERKNRELQKQIESLKSSLKNFGNKSPSPRRSPRQVQVVEVIRKALKKYKVGFRSLLDTLDKEHLGYVDIEEFIKVFRNYGKNFKKSELEDLIDKKFGKTVINLIKLQKTYSKLKKSRSSSDSEEKQLIQTSNIPIFSSEFSPSELKTPEKPEKIEKEVMDILRHISLCMQLHRIQKTQIFETFFSTLDPDSPLNRSDLSKIMKSTPFTFPEKVSTDKLCEFLLGGLKNSSFLKVSVIVAKLEKFLPDWQIFDSDEEEQFDNELTRVIMKYKKQIKENCRNFDKKETGAISLEQFKIAIKEYKELVKERIFQYMTLLFYSHENELDKVPYIHFIRAYGDQNNEESQEYSESEKAQIAKHYLHEIAQALKKHKQTIRQVFQVENKLIYPESFITGLESLGLKNIEHDFLILILEALQYEKENEACIFIDEFEKIMENFGVSSDKHAHNIQANESIDSSYSEEIKKISIAESGNYEYSDDSPGGKKISQISPFASSSNPHMKKHSSNSYKTKTGNEGPKEMNEPSSKFTLAISKIEKQTYRKKDSSSDSIEDILKQSEKDSISSSFNSKKKNQAINLKELRVEEKKIVVNEKLSSSQPGKGKIENNGVQLERYRNESEAKEKEKEIWNKNEGAKFLITSQESFEEVKILKKENIIQKEESYSSSIYGDDQDFDSEHNDQKEDEFAENSESLISEKHQLTRQKSEQDLKNMMKISSSSISSSSELEDKKKSSFTLGPKLEGKQISYSSDSKSSESSKNSKILSKPLKKSSKKSSTPSISSNSSKSSSSKITKNPNLPLVFQEDLKKNYSGNATAKFENIEASSGPLYSVIPSEPLKPPGGLDHSTKAMPLPPIISPVKPLVVSHLPPIPNSLQSNPPTFTSERIAPAAFPDIGSKNNEPEQFDYSSSDYESSSSESKTLKKSESIYSKKSLGDKKVKEKKTIESFEGKKNQYEDSHGSSSIFGKVEGQLEYRVETPETPFKPNNQLDSPIFLESSERKLKSSSSSSSSKKSSTYSDKFSEAYKEDSKKEKILPQKQSLKHSQSKSRSSSSSSKQSLNNLITPPNKPLSSSSSSSSSSKSFKSPPRTEPVTISNPVIPKVPSSEPSEEKYESEEFIAEDFSSDSSQSDEMF